MDQTKNTPALSDEAIERMNELLRMNTRDKRTLSQAVRDFYEPLLRERDARIAALEGALEDARVELISAGPHLPKVGQKLAMVCINEIDAILTPPQSTGNNT